MSNKNPWEEFPHIWASKAKFITFVRGLIRKGWSTYPVKTEFNKAKRVRKVNPKTGKMCYGHHCALCGEFFSQSDIEQDHLSGHNKFTDLSDAESYMKALFYINFEDLQPVCKPCHKIKNYAERMGITFEESRIEKQLIAICKDIKKCNKLLASHNLPCNNAKVRKEGVRKLLEERKI